MRRPQNRSDITRARLCDAFRRSLLENGLEATTADAVLADTGLSKGAMYHHFASKTEIIEAIYRAESHGAITRASARVDHLTDPVEQLKEACLAWLAELEQPEVGRILLEIGPTALGVKRVVEIENELSLSLIEGLLLEAAQSGIVDLTEPRVAARLINALIGEVAVQRYSDRVLAVRAVGPAIDAILAALAKD